MKNQGKYLSCLLISVLFISMIQTNTVFAAASLSASADTASVQEGSYVNVSINLGSNPSISTLGMELSYDSSTLSYDSVSWDGSFSESDMKMASDTGSEVNLSVVCDSSYSADGKVVTVRFRGISDASSIPVTLSLREMSDEDMDEISDCKVSSRVLVPETSNKKEDTSGGKKYADKKTVNSSSKRDNELNQKTETKPGIDSENQQQNSYANQTANVSGTNVSNTAAASLQETAVIADSGAKGIAVRQKQSVSTANTVSTKPDQSYKTGAGIGNDIFLLLAVVCGILALVMTLRKYGEGEK